MAIQVKGLQHSLNIVGEFGKLNSIKFNPDKTLYKVFNPKSKTANKTMKYQKFDELIRLKLDNEYINEINRFKYLGHEISDSICGKDHSLTRRMKAAASFHSIKSMGLNSNELSLTTKVLLFKVYVRPVLLYGCDAFMLSKKDTNNMKKLESNKLKEAFGLSHRVSTNNFLLALGINSMYYRLNTMKLSLF